MSTVALMIATALVVTGAVAAAGTTIAHDRAVAAVTAGAVLLVIADSESMTTGATTRSLSTAGVPLAVALLGIVVVGWRPATALALSASVVAGPVRQLLDDPFHNPACVARCDPNPLVVAAHPALADVAYVAGGVVLLAALLVPARHPSARALLLGAVALVAAPISLAATLTGLVLAALVGVAVLIADLMRAATIAARLTGAVAALAVTSDAEQVLAEALGRRSVSLAYRVGAEDLVDSYGGPLPLVSLGWGVVDITGPDGVIAQLRADLTGITPVTLIVALRGPVRLALENNRLAAEVQVRSAEIRASARRLVDLAEVERRRLERDLHDGAQRHVLTLGMAVASADNLPESVRREAVLSVRSVLDQLRDVAHGIRPPQLDIGGLARGLADLADRSPVPLDVKPVPDGVDATTAEVAYRLVEDVVRSAAGPVAVRIGAVAESWRLEVTSAEDGELSARASARFRALGGAVQSEHLGRGWRHLADVPRRLQ